MHIFCWLQWIFQTFLFLFFRSEQQQVCFEMVRSHLLLDFKYGVFLIFDLVFEGISSLLISPVKLNGAVSLEMNLRHRLETATCNCLNLICSYWGWWQNDEILSCFSCCSTHEAGKLICIFWYRIEESSNPKPIWPGTVLLDRKHPDWLACYPQQGAFLVLRLVALCKSTITTSELYGIKRDPWLYSELLFTNASLEYLTLGPLGCEPGTPNS